LQTLFAVTVAGSQECEDLQHLWEKNCICTYSTIRESCVHLYKVFSSVLLFSYIICRISMFIWFIFANINRWFEVSWLWSKKPASADRR